MTHRPPRHRRVLGLAAVLAVAVGGCHAASATTTSTTTTTSQGAATSISVTTCGQQIHLDHAPRKVVMLGDTDAGALARLGLLDRVVARTGELPTAPYDAETVRRLKQVPTLQASKSATGGDRVSTEAVLATGTDLVVGYDAGVDRAGLAAAGVPLYTPDAFCPTQSSRAVGFGDVDREVRRVATLFGVVPDGETAIRQLHRELAAVKPTGRHQTAAALYVSPGSKAFYAYGPPSMAQPVMAAAGLRNVYGDQHKRVFDATMEDLLRRNPDRIVLLHGEGQADEVKRTFLGFNGVDGLTAVQHGDVVVLPFSLVDPPGPGSVQGAAQLAKLVAA